MSRKISALLFILVLFSSAASFADESDLPPEPQIVVTLGAGRVTVQSEGLELTEETLQLLQTELLVDDKLSAVVMSESVTRLILTGIEIQKLKNLTSEHSKQAADQIQSLVTKEMRPENSLPPPATDVKEPATLQFDREVLSLNRSLEYLGTWLRDSVFFWWGNIATLLLMGLFGWIWSWLVVYFLIHQLPGFLSSCQNQWAQRKFGAFIWGLLISVGWLPLFIILAITVIGILFIPALVTLFFVWIGLAYALLIKYVGDSLGFTRAWPLGLQLLLAQLLWMGIGFVPVAGNLARFVLMLISMGVVIFALGPRMTGRTT